MAPDTPSNRIFINSRSPFAITSSIRYLLAPGSINPDSRLIIISKRPNNNRLRLGQIIVLKTFLKEARYFAIIMDYLIKKFYPVQLEVEPAK
jgi:hypothetical protein